VVGRSDRSAGRHDLGAVRDAGLWALEDRLVDLTGPVGSFSNQFDPNQLARAMLFNAKTGQRILYGCDSLLDSLL
jgi:hypothetical protein